MRILSLDLLDFRNYEKVSLQFEDRFNFFIGENASGKTNLLEALGYIVSGKSFRGASDADLVRRGQGHFFFKCHFMDRHDIETRLEIGFEAGTPSRKKVKRNGTVLKRMSDMLGSILAVVLAPEDLGIVQGGHQERRSYLDGVLGGLDSEYLEALLQFNRALRQRNELLRAIQEKRARLDDLLPWDEQFIRHGSLVQARRRQFLAEFEPVVLRSIEKISGARDRLSLVLESSDEEQLRGALKEKRFEEVRAGHSLVGPHRNRLYFRDASGVDVAVCFSQGQKRTLALALKVAQFYYLKERTGKPPVLLIDDVLQELDGRRRRAFLELLEECGQAFFTTPDLEGDRLVYRSLPSSRLFVVRDGQVLRDGLEGTGSEA